MLLYSLALDIALRHFRDSSGKLFIVTKAGSYARNAVFYLVDTVKAGDYDVLRDADIMFFQNVYRCYRQQTVSGGDGAGGRSD